MKSILTVSISLFFVIPAVSEEKIPVKPPKAGYQEVDMNQFKNLDTSKPASSSAVVKFEGVCTTSAGIDLKPSDAGFERCMTDAAANSASQGNSDKKHNGPTQSYKVKFGNK